MIEVIIATYNRYQTAHNLALNLIESTKAIDSVIIVNSDSNKNVLKSVHPKIKRISTSHQNQPYQRYLGYRVSTAPHLLFLDDDMELIDSKVFDDINSLFEDQKIVAINLPFENNNNFLENQPKGLVDAENKLRKIIGLLSGYPMAKPNHYICNGIRGSRLSGKPIEYLSGGAFAVKREALYVNFNMQLFSIYEEKLGKGEDGILGYTLNKQGRIFAYPEKCFVHNDFKDSTYSNSQKAFTTRVLFSRLYLSCEYYRLNERSIIYAYLRFYHYILGRLVGSVVSYLLKPTKIKYDILMGSFSALVKSLKFKFHDSLKDNSNWNLEVTKELKGN